MFHIKRLLASRPLASLLVTSTLPCTYKSYFSTAATTLFPHTIRQFAANDPIEDRATFTVLDPASAPTICMAVYDGHGGASTADYASQILPEAIKERLHANNKSKGGLSQQQIVKKSIQQAFDHVESKCLARFQQSLKNKQIQSLTTGSCALVALVHNKKLYVANSGDCEGLLINADGSFRILNRRHNAGEPEEQERLKKLFPNESDLIVKQQTACYLKGCLQCTHSFGDFYLKKKQYNFANLSTFTGPYVDYHPQISVFDIKESDQYVLLATDGLWDQLDHAAVTRVIQETAGGVEKKGDQLVERGLKHAAFEASLRMKEFMAVKGKRRRYLHDDISIVLLDLQKSTASKA